MRSGGTTSNTDCISGRLPGPDTRHTGSDTRHRYPSGIPSPYSASRPLLGRDGQDSEGAMETRQRPVVRGKHADPTVRRTSDHEDSRRLASGLPIDLSGDDSGRIPGSYPRTDRSVLGRQTDPGDRRTSDWRSSTWGSHPNLEPVPGTGTGSRHGPRITLWDSPKRLMMLLSGTDNPRNHSNEVEELQSRACEYTQQQLEQMDDWDRAFYREWTSLVSRNALAPPYPMGEPKESSKVKLRRPRQRRSVAARDISPQARTNTGADSPRRQWTSQLGGGTTLVSSEYSVNTVKGFPILRGIPSPLQWKEMGRMGRQHPDRPKLPELPELGIPTPLPEERC